MLLGVVAAALAACSFSNLAFAADHRLRFLSPPNRALVVTPVTLRWAISDFTVTPPGQSPPSPASGYFGIFVDRVPIRPGQTLADVAGGDQSCKRTAGCPDAQYLAAREVYATARTSFTLTQVSQLSARQRVQTHQVTVVLLDSGGHRIGEAAWYREFRLKRRSSP